ncbi:c-type cytochrome [Shewanella salipaludis]|uniref:Cytochrome c n=1 Tax=Shewanella salipaludis TaxID=2723052 RepID=A0A972JNZ2_9GAMM|nr:cytochrome c [Shewanella salipaludis]NMH66651.1 cytochrome c [Shewanella salipaludis]
MKLLSFTALFLALFGAVNTHAADVGNGELLYRAYCTQCHGKNGDGWGVNAATMDVLPKDHTDTQEMITRTDADIFKAIKEGGKAVSKSNLMPNWDANMTDEEIKDLVAYVRSVCCAKESS